jgi:hypothetical protein
VSESERGGDIPIDFRGAEAFEVIDGKISRVIAAYSDVATSLADLGPAG